MSSKFSGLLSQARNRTTEEEQEETPTIAQASEKEEPQSVPEPEAVPAQLAPTQPKVTVRPKTASKPRQLEVSELTTEDVPASVPSQGATRGRPSNGKSSNPNYTQITAYISKQTHKDMKMALLVEGEGREISELVEELLQNWIQNQK